MKNKISKIETGVITAAFLVCAVQLALIGYGSWKLGLVVPTCVTNVKPFETGKFITHAPVSMSHSRSAQVEPHRLKRRR
jgi:hypothetical protein